MSLFKQPNYEPPIRQTTWGYVLRDPLVYVIVRTGTYQPEMHGCAIALKNYSLLLASPRR